MRFMKKSTKFFVLVAGVLSLAVVLLKTDNASAAVINAPTAPTSTSAITTTSIKYNWTWGGGDEDRWRLEQSTDGVSFTYVTTTVPTTTVNYTFTGLATNTEYWFRVAAATSTSVTSSFANSSGTYTRANTAGTPTVGTATSSTLPITINFAGNPTSTQFAIYDATNNNYLDATGAVSTSPTWQTTSTWGDNFPAINLATNTIHQFTVIARNGDGLQAATSTATAATYTLADKAGTPTVGTATSSTLPITINFSSNPTSTQFAIYDATNNNYLNADGTSSSSPTWQTTSTWGASFSAINLATNTIHQFTVISRNGNSVQTATSTASTAKYTLAVRAGAPTIGTVTATTAPITIVVNGNSSSTTYALFNTTTSKYLDSAGADTTTPVWQTTSTWGASFAATGLTANTSYQFSAIARNGDLVQAATSTLSTATHSLPSVPTSAGITVGSNALTFNWTGDAAEYYAEDETAGSNSGWTTATSFGTASIDCGTSHNFRVKGRNAENAETAFTSDVGGTTTNCGSGIAVSSGGGGSWAAPVTPAKPAVPAVPGVFPAVPATPASPASPVAVFVHTLGVGSKGAEVKALQAKLRELGYFKYSSDTGLFGAVTKAAVVAFQKAEGLTASGSVDSDTRDALNGNSASAEAPASSMASPTAVFVHLLNVGSKGAEVKALQAKLRELGYFTYPTDTGSFGAATRAAVKAFQKAQGLSQVGFVGPGTRAALNNL